MPRTKVFDKTEALEKAMNIFWEKGYYATSMQDLVNTMGINRSSLYDTFGDKHSLFVEALTSYKNRYGASEVYLNVKPALKAFESFIRDYIKIVAADKESRGCFMLNCTSEIPIQDQDIHTLLKDNLHNLLGMLSTIIANGQKENSLRSDLSPAEMADFVVANLQGLRMMALLDKRKTKLNRIGENLIELLKR